MYTCITGTHFLTLRFPRGLSRLNFENHHMRSLSLYTLGFLMLASLNACARTKKTASSGSSAPVILEATQLRTKPGRPDIPPYTTYRFLIIWKGNTSPTTFFWRPDAAGWLETGIAHPVKRPGLAPGDFMVVERNIDFKNVRYGDTLIITTRHHSHDADGIPSSVKKMPVKSLYYQTASAPDKWMYTPVNVKKLPDMNLP